MYPTEWPCQLFAIINLIQPFFSSILWWCGSQSLSIKIFQFLDQLVALEWLLSWFLLCYITSQAIFTNATSYYRPNISLQQLQQHESLLNTRSTTTGLKPLSQSAINEWKATQVFQYNWYPTVPSILYLFCPTNTQANSWLNGGYWVGGEPLQWMQINSCILK